MLDPAFLAHFQCLGWSRVSERYTFSRIDHMELRIRAMFGVTRIFN